MTRRRALFPLAALVALALAACLGGVSAAPGAAPGGPPTAPLASGGRHVLFIGNSLTYFNDLPRTLADMGAAVGDTIRVKSVALPNLALIDHAMGLSNANAVIQAEPWNFVVLQQGPTTLAANRDTLVIAAQRFEPLVRAAGGRTVLLETWPSRAFLKDFDAVRASVDSAARAVNGIVAPAGDAWRRAWAADATLPFYGPDDYHPSPLGTYVAALVLFETITGRDARTLPARASVAGSDIGIPEALVRRLQAVAHETK